MLPFLDPKKIASAAMTVKGGKTMEHNPEVEAPDSDMDGGLKSAAEDVLMAIEHKSVMDLAKALKSAFMILDAMPHEEGEHEEEAEE
jgi:hypothetical protein